jgi:hypothetical protein
MEISMDYFVHRGEKTYGPYTLAELQAYVQSGNIQLGDLARSEGMSEAVPVSQILGNIPLSQIPSTPAAAPAAALVPLPPNLHWGILLLLDIITRQFFSMIWVFVQANWARKLSSSNAAMVLVAMSPAGILAGIIAIGAGIAINGDSEATPMVSLGALFFIAGAIANIIGIFKIRAAMQDYYNSRENIRLHLSAPMTFFFNNVYLQYHINRIVRWKKTGILS